MERKNYEVKSKSNKVVKTIISLMGSVAVCAVASWVMPKVQKKVADKMYNKMM